MTFVSDVAEAMKERALRGEPEPGVYVCLRCGRDDCRMYTRVLDPAAGREAMGELNRLNRFDATAWMQNVVGELLCPCCSFPLLSGCSHPAKVDCSVCGLPTEPAGSLFGGGPFVRCDGPGSHERVLA